MTIYKRFLAVVVLTAAANFSIVTSAHAKSAKQQAKDYCKSWKKRNPGQNCGYVRGLICTGRDYVKLKTFKILWTACKQVRGKADRKKAVKRCAEHQKYWSKGACKVQYPRCKAGWTKLGKYGKYKACRRLKPSGSLLYDIYQAFMKKWEGKAPRGMSDAQKRFVKKYYNINVTGVRWGQVSNPYATCTTDCTKIYCKSSAKVYKHIKNQTLSRLMFHELAHVEQCRQKGGRKGFAKLWFGNLPRGFFKALKPGVKGKFKKKVHGRMPMESQAKSKAARVYGIYTKGLYHKAWRCRLYRDNKVVWSTTNTYFRLQCEDKSHSTYRDARKNYNKLKSKGGKFIYVFGRKDATHIKMWTKNIRKPSVRSRATGGFRN